MEISENCSAIAFYGIDLDKVPIAEYYYSLTGWLRKVGCPVDKMAIRIRHVKSGWTSVKAGEVRLRKSGFKEVTSLSMVSMVPGGRIPTNDFLATTSISAKFVYADLICRSSVVPLGHPAMRSIANEMIKWATPRYGIGYTRAHRLGPSMYSVGICQGLGRECSGIQSMMSDDEREESLRISRWGNAMMTHIWEKGIIRDVYPWNFLTPLHLEMPIGHLSLKSWIYDDKNRGQLIPVGESTYLWELDDNQIPPIRRALNNAGLIFDWRKHL